MLSFEEAQQLIIKQANSFGEELIGLDDVYGRVLASAIIADRDYPPFNRASMDGYAIRKIDWDNGKRAFTIIETIYAGGISSGSLNEGDCYKIMTGAAVPDNADVVIRREDVTEIGIGITVRDINVRYYQNIAKKGEDIKASTIVIEKGNLCTTPVLGLLASIGAAEILVKKLPRVAILTTGDEVVGVKDKVSSVQIRNSNLYTLKALLKQWKIEPYFVQHIPDEIEKLKAIIAAADSNDLLLLTGGVSAGDADHVPAILEELGLQLFFHKVAIKPGKPLLFGKLPSGAIIFALPGNPFSTMVTFRLFVDLFLSCCFELEITNKSISLPFNGEREKKSSLDEFFPVKLSGNPAVLEPLKFNGSGDITASINADGVARHPATIKNLSRGIVLDFYPLV